MLDVNLTVGGLAALLVLAALPTGAASVPAELATLGAMWGKVDDYQATIVADEFDGATKQERKFQFSYLRPDHVKAEITDGALRGMVAIWNGGDRVTVFHRGMLAGVRVGFALHDRVVTSPRGNTVAAADFSAALKCYDLHPDLVHVHDGPQIDGADTTEFMMEDAAPLDCPGYSEKDRTSITKDALIVDAKTSLPLRRLRYAGEALVEKWEITKLRVNTGLTQADFR